jgi:hypothetical protein
VGGKKKNTKNFVQTYGRLNLSPSISPLNTFKTSISIMASTEAAQLPPAGKWEQTQESGHGTLVY